MDQYDQAREYRRHSQVMTFIILWVFGVAGIALLVFNS